MKKVGLMLMVLLVSASLIFVGCNGGAQQNQEQVQEQQENTMQNESDKADLASANVQKAETQILTLQGVFQGLADGHSAEITVDDEATVFQFYDTTVAEQLEYMETGTMVQFDVEADVETGMMTIVKLYDVIK